ncbi:MAG: RsmE family RNA methyltransferase [Oligoflexia bacterium]|nr:RsmE family RNA methyltransferase [Oligoflexia bacterium]
MTKRVLCARLPRPGHPEPLPETESEHVTRVLRLRDGDVLEALDGQGHAAKVTLRIRGGAPRLEFLESKAAEASGVLPLTLEMAILKAEAMEWVVEKAVELGVRTLVPLITAHTVVQVKNKGPEAFRERWQKIADQSLKQCGRLERLEIQTPIALENWIAQNPGKKDCPRLWCDEAGRGGKQGAVDLAHWLFENGAHLQQCRLLIGPEGGWSDLERQLLESGQEFAPIKVSLGPYVLRGETAALYAVSLVIATLRQI